MIPKQKALSMREVDLENDVLATDQRIHDAPVSGRPALCGCRDGNDVAGREKVGNTRPQDRQAPAYRSNDVRARLH